MSIMRFKEQQEASSPFAFLRFWDQDSAEVQREVAAYHTLSPLQSSRGRSALLALMTGLLTLIVSSATDNTVAGIVVAALYAAIAVWCLGGSRRALVVAMVVFSLDRLAALLSGAVLITLIWWGLGMGLFYRAYTVERARQAQQEVPGPGAA